METEGRDKGRKDVLQTNLPKEDLFFLQEVPGIGNKTLFEIVKAFEEEGYSELWSLQGKNLVTEILEERQIPFFRECYKKGCRDSRKCLCTWEEKGYHYIPYFSSEYPKRMKDLEDAPFALWIKGNMIAENTPSVAIIGARQCSEYGRKIAYQFGKELAGYGVQIVSGMARGIDGYAQKGALYGEGKSFAVLGCGVDICYPKENRDIYDELPQKGGGIISEYAMGTQPESRLFPARNRIISGLSDLVLVVEARRRSGTYITVTQALEQGREVYAVPGRITDELSNGCHNLIKDGAGIATCPEDIMEALAESFPDRNELCEKQMVKDTIQREDGAKEGNNGEEYVLSLMDLTPVNQETLFQRTAGKYSYKELNWILINLKIKGKVDCIGNYYFRL